MLHFTGDLLNLTVMQPVDAILPMGESNRLTRREASVSSLEGAAEDCMSYRNRYRGVTIAREPSLRALGNEGVALTTWHNVVPLILLTCLQGAWVPCLDLRIVSLCQSPK